MNISFFSHRMTMYSINMIIYFFIICKKCTTFTGSNSFIGIKRNNEMLNSITPEEILKQGDIIYVQGSQGDIERFHQEIK